MQAPLNGAAMRQLVIYVTILWRTATRPLHPSSLFQKSTGLWCPLPLGAQLQASVSMKLLDSNFEEASPGQSGPSHLPPVTVWDRGSRGLLPCSSCFHCLCKTSPGLAAILPAKSMELWKASLVTILFATRERLRDCSMT